MAHHSKDPSATPEFFERLGETDIGAEKQRLMDALALGPTGKFPEGKLHETDEGELRMGVTVKYGKVVVAFGKPTAWIGFTKEQAIDLAELIKKRADEI